MYKIRDSSTDNIRCFFNFYNLLYIYIYIISVYIPSNKLI